MLVMADHQIKERNSKDTIRFKCKELFGFILSVQFQGIVEMANEHNVPVSSSWNQALLKIHQSNNRAPATYLMLIVPHSYPMKI